jgi:hypothetical protein
MYQGETAFNSAAGGDGRQAPPLRLAIPSVRSTHDIWTCSVLVVTAHHALMMIDQCVREVDRQKGVYVEGAKLVPAQRPF